MSEKRVKPIMTRKLSVVEPKSVSWLWRGWIPGNALTLVEGESGCGKSTVLTDIVARATTGRPWPDGDVPRGPTDVIWIQTEEAEAEVLVPRLMAAEADLERVHAHVDTDPWNASQSERLRATVETLGAGLVVIDPLKAYLSGADDNNEVDVRAVIQPLGAMGVSVVGVRHWTKGARRASERGGGSLGYRAVARASIVVAKSPDSDGVIIAPEKSSLGRAATPWEFAIVDGEFIAGDHRPVVKWKFERTDITADALSMHIPDVAAKLSKREAGQNAIVECLREHGGEAGRAKVLQAANDAGVAQRTAEDSLGDLRDSGRVTVEKREFGGSGIVRLVDPRTG